MQGTSSSGIRIDLDHFVSYGNATDVKMSNIKDSQFLIVPIVSAPSH